jgi:hypothetical protein
MSSSLTEKSVASILRVEEVTYCPKFLSSMFLRNVRIYIKIAQYDTQENCPNIWEKIYTSHKVKEVCHLKSALGKYDWITWNTRFILASCINFSKWQMCVQAYLVTNRKTQDHTFPATPAHPCGPTYVFESVRVIKFFSRERKTLAIQPLRSLWKNLFYKLFDLYNNQVG